MGSGDSRDEVPMIVVISLVGIPVLAGMLLLVRLFAPSHRIFRRPERPFRPGILHLMILVAIAGCDYWLSVPDAELRRNPRTVLLFACDLLFLVAVPAVGVFRTLGLLGWLAIAMIVDIAVMGIMFGLEFVVPAH
jgi:hypothetical protein